MTNDRLGPIELDRAAGVLVGAAVGDALGAGYEFGAPCAAEAVEMRRGALTGRPAGSWTDDTDMAVAVAQVAATGARLDEVEGRRAVAARFGAWYASGPPDIGNQTRAALSAAIGSPDPDALGQAALAYQRKHPEAAGNGSLMRTGPVALGALGDDDRILASASAISVLTHPHARTREACQLWCIAIDRAVREGRLDGISDGLALLEPKGHGYWHSAIEEAETAPLSALRNNGFVVTALQSAWRAIRSTDGASGPAHLEAALRAAVATGGDTDTVAAIAGALLGARYGASAVPFSWRRRLGGWPTDVTHADLVPLAVLAVTRGEPDRTGWPLGDDLLEHYVRGFHPSGHLSALPGHDDVLWGDVVGLPRIEADAFVSLCRIGRGQRRGREHHEIWLVDDEQNADVAFVLADTADAIEAMRKEVGTVFVHCVRAESRTPTVAAAWLVRHQGYDPEAALTEVCWAMPQARPCPAMRAGLKGVPPVANRGLPDV
jgi:ADP-ribosylglycohydrolase